MLYIEKIRQLSIVTIDGLSSDNSIRSAFDFIENEDLEKT